MKITTRIMALSAMLGLAAGAVSASTIGFDEAKPPGGPKSGYVEDGLEFDYARIVNGRCDSTSGAPCLALKRKQQTEVTAVNGGTFSLTSFWYQLVGKGNVNTLTVTSNLGGIMTFDAMTDGWNDGGDTISLAANPLFQNVSSLLFSHKRGGNVRIDDLITTNGVSPVPLPAAGLLLIAGLGGLGALRLRRNPA